MGAQERLRVADLSAQQRTALTGAIVQQVSRLSEDAREAEKAIHTLQARATEAERAAVALKADYAGHIAWHESRTLWSRLRWLVTGR